MKTIENENFWVTPYLRFVKRQIHKEQPGFEMHGIILQQMWQGSNGTQKWEDIEIIEE